jgi:hypothetical protein
VRETINLPKTQARSQKKIFSPNLSNPLFQRLIPFSFPLFYLLKMKFRLKENLKRKTFKFFGADKPTSVPRVL